MILNPKYLRATVEKSFNFWYNFLIFKNLQLCKKHKNAF